ncbi:formate dehydrogenase accessory sulfurtransferase FdhD [Kribbella sp. NPDC055110]
MRGGRLCGSRRPGVAKGPTRSRLRSRSSCELTARLRAKTRYSPAADDVTIRYDVLATLPDALRVRQQVFDRTGGLHAAGLFTPTGELLVVREDVGPNG